MTGPSTPNFSNDIRLLVTGGYELNPTPNEGPNFFISYLTRDGFSQPFSDTGQSGAEVVTDITLRFWPEHVGNMIFDNEAQAESLSSPETVGTVGFNR